MGIRHFSTQIKSVFLTSDQNWILGFSPKSLLVVVQFYCLKQIGMKGHLVLLEKKVVLMTSWSLFRRFALCCF